ncbi:hypothetical protein CVT26_007714 [Gymnopilus dilepis]|uniref:Uncharacterized protein n=1 Tax=Gymnopilus dilepis TaxID=231916 RepID=A0A409WWM6_9AGAR|nr:hypothetical protein CVT26_007714 [Gymnopilus dilepis]
MVLRWWCTDVEGGGWAVRKIITLYEGEDLGNKSAPDYDPGAGRAYLSCRTRQLQDLWVEESAAFGVGGQTRVLGSPRRGCQTLRSYKSARGGRRAAVLVVWVVESLAKDQQREVLTSRIDRASCVEDASSVSQLLEGVSWKMKRPRRAARRLTTVLGGANVERHIEQEADERRGEEEIEGGVEEERRGGEKRRLESLLDMEGRGQLLYTSKGSVACRLGLCEWGTEEEMSMGRTLSAKRARRSLRRSPSLPPSLLPSRVFQYE